MVPENEFEESEDEETNALHGVRYSKSMRSGRVKDSADGSSKPAGAPRVRGTVDHLPAAATKLNSNGHNGVTQKGGSNNTHTSGDATPAPAPAPASVPAPTPAAPEPVKVPEPAITVVVPEVTVEKDGDTVMASAPEAPVSEPKPESAEVTVPGSSQQDTDMADASSS